jgi:hypothetical protein
MFVFLCAILVTYVCRLQNRFGFKSWVDNINSTEQGMFVQYVEEETGTKTRRCNMANTRALHWTRTRVVPFTSHA